MNYHVGDIVKDRYSDFKGIVTGQNTTGLLKIVSIVPGEHTRLRYLQETSVIPTGTPYRGSVVSTEFGSGLLRSYARDLAVVQLDDDTVVRVPSSEVITNIFDNEYVDNRYLDLFPAPEPDYSTDEDSEAPRKVSKSDEAAFKAMGIWREKSDE